MTPGRRKLSEYLISIMLLIKRACMTWPRGRMPITVYRFLNEIQYHYLRTRKLHKRIYTAIPIGGVLPIIVFTKKHEHKNSFSVKLAVSMLNVDEMLSECH